MAEKFTGSYIMTPDTDLSGDVAAFSFIRPQGVTEEDLKKGHTVKCEGQGDTMKVTTNINGKEKVETFTVGGTIERPIPTGATVKVTSKWEGDHIVATVHGPAGEVKMDRWIEGDKMKLKLNMGSSECMAVYHKQ